MSLVCAGLSDIGRCRSENQDHFIVARLRNSMLIDETNVVGDENGHWWSDVEGHLLMVADGMGGHAGGAEASQLAIDAAATYVLNSLPWFFQLSAACETDVLHELKRTLEHSQQELIKRAESEPVLHEMGTTLTMAYVLGATMYVAHVGDSRCYLYRDGTLVQLTRDHTWAQSMVERGLLTQAQAAISPLGRVLWNIIGGTRHRELDPEVYKCSLKKDDTILLCSDGLPIDVPSTTIAEILGEDRQPTDLCRRLINQPLSAGGSDNITVIVAHVADSPAYQSTNGALSQADSTADCNRLADTTPD
ncbi:MAG: protein phosphatase [Pirellulaceae bacterium]|nr:MAG: protein phosphatase [Pirellulaceae bacterium]